MKTVTGNLKDIHGAALNDASVVFQLCAFGSALPRVSGTALVAKTGQIVVDCPAGTFSVDLYGNDTIVPAGTYYTVTIRDENGDIVQVDAYQVTGGGSVDLSSLTPYVIP